MFATDVHPAVEAAASIVGVSPRYAAELLLPDDARMLSQEQRELRARLFHEMYEKQLSLQDLGDIAGGLSKERVRQIMRDHGYDTRPLPGSKRWRDAKRERQVKEAREAAVAQYGAG